MAAVQELEQHLGDPADPGRLISCQRSTDLDQREQFPDAECRELDRLGIPAHYAPRAWGGALERLDTSAELLRVVARRDLSLAIAHGKTFLGCVPVWVGGDDDQARRLAADVVRGAVVSWGLTERDHGGDLAAGDVSAVRNSDGYVLDGEKWLINNARRNHLACVLARTSPDPGPRSHSVFLVERAALPSGAYVPLEPERLHGIRGADISGFRLHGAPVPAAARIGAEGHGLEIVLKSLLLTRAMCAGLSLGAADHGLGIALRHATTVHRYGRPVIDLPQTRRLLADVLGDLLLAEALAVAAVRSVQALPGEVAVTSAAAKYLVPTLVQQALTRFTELVGTRSLLVGATFADACLQKLHRDHRIVGIFDGSTVVNLHALINTFPFLNRSGPGYDPGSGPRSAALDAAVRRDAELPPLDLRAVELVPRRGAALLAAVPAAAATVRGLAGAPGVPAELVELTAWLAGACAAIGTAAAARRPAARPPADDFALAQEVAGCVAGAAALHTWLANRHLAGTAAAGPLWDDALWVRSALARLRARATRREPAVAAWRDPLVEAVAAAGDVSLLRTEPTGRGVHP